MLINTAAHESKIQRRLRNEVSHSKRFLQTVATASTTHAYCETASLSTPAAFARLSPLIPRDLQTEWNEIASRRLPGGAQRSLRAIWPPASEGSAGARAVPLHVGNVVSGLLCFSRQRSSRMTIQPRTAEIGSQRGSAIIVVSASATTMGISPKIGR